MLLALAFYGGLAGLALVATWRTHELRWLGAALVLGYLLSNAAHFYLPFEERPALFTVIEIGISLAAFIGRSLGAPRGTVLVISISALSVTANIAISLYSEPSHSQINVWEGITNLCYIGECLVTASTGIYANGWLERFHCGATDRAGDATHTRRRPE
jgi:hypothetical protein